MANITLPMKVIIPLQDLGLSQGGVQGLDLDFCLLGPRLDIKVG